MCERRRRFLLLSTVGVVLSANILIRGYEIVFALTTRSILGYVEGTWMYLSKNWEYMFHPISQDPYLVTNFPPLFPVLVGLLDRVLQNVFVTSRLIVIIASIGTAVLLAGAVYHETDAMTGSATAAALFFLSPIIATYGLFRVDVLGVFFATAALYCFITKEGYPQIAWPVFFSLLAMYSKHSLLAAPVAIFVTLLLRGQHRRALLFGVTLGSTGLGILAALTFVTDGQAWLHLVVYNSNEYNIGGLLLTGRSFLTEHAILVVVAAFTILHRDRFGVPTVLLVFTIAAGAVSLLSGKIGAGTNYFIEFIVGAAALSGLLVSSVAPRLRDVNTNDRLQTLVIVLLIVQLAIFVSPPVTTSPGAADAAAAIQNAEGPVLSEDTALLVATGHDVQYQPFLMTQLNKQGVWNDSLIVDAIRSHKYDYIVLHSDINTTTTTYRWTPQQRETIRSEYTLERRVGNYWIYDPVRK